MGAEGQDELVSLFAGTRAMQVTLFTVCEREMEVSQRKSLEGFGCLLFLSCYLTVSTYQPSLTRGRFPSQSGRSLALSIIAKIWVWDRSVPPFGNGSIQYTANANYHGILFPTKLS